MNLANEFLLNAPRSAVWAGLTNPEIAVPCMPGTELNERVGENGFKATVSLKVGPVKLQFRGEGELMNLSADGSYGEVVAKGSDSKGRGGFKAEMKFRLSEEGSQKCRVQVDTELSLTGSVAQYGRGVGIVKEVAGQLTSDFTKNLESRVMPAAGVINTSATAQALRTGSEAQGSSINVFSLVFSSFFRWIRSLFAPRS
jgi:carbon monoxide dehydrogenase subunit G